VTKANAISDGIFIIKAFTNWKKSTGSHSKDNKLLKHALSESHKTACMITSPDDSMLKPGRTVYSMIHKQNADEQKSNLDRLTDFTNVVYYLFKQEIPHTTHYRSLLDLVSKLDGSDRIKHFMATSPENASYNSETTATELLEAVSLWLRRKIVESLCSSTYISLMGDEATDIRGRTELSICFRFVVDGEAVEKYFMLRQVQSTVGSDIAKAILEMLRTHNIPLNKIYWLEFDGAANMSGRTNGVQALLKSDLVNANYIHCRSHLLNLAAANVANVFKPLKGLFSMFNSLWKFFRISPKRNNQFVEVKKILDDPALDLVRVGDTRWTSNYRAVKAIRTCLRAITVTLQDIHTTAGDLSSEAGGLLLTFQNQTSILLIFALEQILLPLNILTLTLQSPKLSLAELPIKVRAVLFY